MESKLCGCASAALGACNGSDARLSELYGSEVGMTRKLALVTGASAGIGAAFARALAARGYDLALSARRADRLETLAAELRAGFGVEALTAPGDLASPQGVGDVLAQIARPIDVLVNNAGYGLPGAFAQTRWAEQQAFLQLMVTAPCELAHRLLPAMVERRFGRIVNVASVAGLVPGAAGHTLYAGAKSLMIKFSQSLNLEGGPHGVHVTALCPGFTYTEFHDVNGTRARVSAAIPRWAWLQADAVAEAGWRAVEANRAICVPGLAYKLVCGVARLVPDSLSLAVMRAQGPRFREL
jgi:short-subunit dehydrogenase